MEEEEATTTDGEEVEEATTTEGEEEDYDVDKRHDLRSLLASEGRDFFVRNNGDEVKISELEGKTVGLYFSASWCGPCRRFTPILADVYTELASRDSNFQIVFVSSDEDDEDFSDYFSKMPWLAIPFSDEDKRESLSHVFGLEGIPTLVIIDKNGEVLTDEAVQVVRDYGAEGYPFTSEKIDKLKEEEEAARLNQTIQSLLVTTTRDFLLTSNFKKVPVSDLGGKIVGLYFSLSSFEACARFTRRLLKIYDELKVRGENFEIVLVSLEEDEPSFMDDFEDMPWLGIPFKDKQREKLVRYFELEDLPTLVVIGANGKTVNLNAVELVEDYGIESYPFTSKKLKELKKKEKARIESQTLESLLISGGKDFVIKNDDSKVSILDLVGKNILLYFSAHWCPPCRAFLPHLIEAYNQIKEKDDAFEIIFISSDEDEESFEDYFSKMPWLALPFSDERKRFLSRVFKIGGIPSCVAIDRAGKTIAKEARSLIMEYGASAYPFTKESIIQLKAEMEEKAKNWPEKIRHREHIHVLWKSKREYNCDGCGNSGRDWSFHCKKCDFDLHPHCALDDGHEEVDSEDEEEEDEWPEKIKHMLHKHALLKAWRHYQCDVCGVIEQGWSYFCEECDFDLHPECALGNQASFKVVDDSDYESDEDVDEDEDENEEEDEDGVDNYGNVNGNKKVTSGDDEDLVKVDNQWDINGIKVRSSDDEDIVKVDNQWNINGNKVGNSDDEDLVKVEDEVEFIHSDFKQELQLRDDIDGDEEKEEKESKIENGDDNKVADEEKVGEEEEVEKVGEEEKEEKDGEEEDEKDGEEDEEEDDDDDDDEDEDEDEEDEDDDEDGPGMRGYVCTTIDRESSVSFQESLFTCRLYK